MVVDALLFEFMTTCELWAARLREANIARSEASPAERRARARAITKIDEARLWVSETMALGE